MPSFLNLRRHLGEREWTKTVGPPGRKSMSVLEGDSKGDVRGTRFDGSRRT